MYILRRQHHLTCSISSVLFHTGGDFGERFEVLRGRDAAVVRAPEAVCAEGPAAQMVCCRRHCFLARCPGSGSVVLLSVLSLEQREVNGDLMSVQPGQGTGAGCSPGPTWNVRKIIELAVLIEIPGTSAVVIVMTGC